MPALLAGLPPRDLARLRPALQRVHLALRQVLHQPGEPVAHVYFPIDSLISLLTVLEDGGAIETGLVGHEGLAGLSVFFRAPVADRRAVCQHPGDAWRLDSTAFLAEVDRHGALSSSLLLYAHFVLRVAAQTAACNRVHPLEERCARWLLMVADRVGGGSAVPAPGSDRSAPAERFAMTQQFMAEMLGVRRASVVIVLGTLASAGMIENTYGVVAILDRAALESAACECYGALRQSP